MNKKILLVQVRSNKDYLEHEKLCFKRNAGKYYKDIKIINGLMDHKKLPNTLKELRQYFCVIVGGSGEADISQLDDQPATKKAVPDLLRFLKLITENDFPFLGLCFGHQLLAYSIGAKVVKDPQQREVGGVKVYLNGRSEKDKLFKKLKRSFRVQEAHNDSVNDLPSDAVLLASSDKCRVQAFRYKNNIYGTQFHAEMDKKEAIERDKLYQKHNPKGKKYKVNKTTFMRSTTKSPEAKRFLNLFLSEYHK